MNGILGRKLGMTRIFDAQGRDVPVTLIKAGPCWVIQVKHRQRDGYDAVQVGFEEVSDKRTNKPRKGHFVKAGVRPMRFLRELTLADGSGEVNPGDQIKADIFSEGDVVKVTGWSKGKGFQGVVKRHNFRGGPKTHGQSDRLRAPGSLGQSSFPSRVFKGLRMGGRTGGEKVTVKNLTVMRVDPEKNLLVIKGSVPGPNDGFVIIQKLYA